MRTKEKTPVTAFSLRCPQILFEKIRLIAGQHRRSMNREIEMAIIEYIDDYEAEHGKLLDNEAPEQLSLI